MNSTNMTLEYYNRNAADFTAGTLNVDFQENQNRFLKMLNRGDLTEYDMSESKIKMSLFRSRNELKKLLEKEGISV